MRDFIDRLGDDLRDAELAEHDLHRATYRYSANTIILALTAGFALGLVATIEHWWQVVIALIIVVVFLHRFFKETAP